MKALLKSTALIVTLTILSTVNLFASSSIDFNDEAYIDDIPFNTKEIYNNVVTDNQLTSFDFEDEEYINDIPFNTECVSVRCLYNKALSVDYQLDEEKYIDDIPFDTKCISIECRYKKAMSVEFTFEEEEFINDIEL